MEHLNDANTLPRNLFLDAHASAYIQTATHITLSLVTYLIQVFRIYQAKTTAI